MEPSAQMKMCAQRITQFVFYGSNNAKCPLVFNWPNNLDNSNFDQFHVFQEVECPLVFNWPNNLDNINFDQFHVFQEVEVEDTRCVDFEPKPCKGIELVLFTQCCFKIMQHDHFEMIGLQIKHVSWRNGIMSWSNPLILQGLQKPLLACSSEEKKFLL
jgi:hypothetical protein